tara:strand:+ start:6982 stop:7254 length:273 start_codon:yes stop_codon:yes gene_type:complete
MKRAKKRKHSRRVKGHNIFVPLDDSLDVTITANFFTKNCKLCGKEFHSFREDATYCSPSHRASAAIQKQRQEVKDLRKEVVRLRKMVNET